MLLCVALAGASAPKSSADSYWGDAPHDAVENLDLTPSCQPEDGNCLTMIPGGMDTIANHLAPNPADNVPLNERGYFIGCTPDTKRAMLLRYPRTDSPVYEPGVDTVSLDHSFYPRFFVWTAEGQFALGYFINGHGIADGMWFAFMPEWHCSLSDNWATSSE